MPEFETQPDLDHVLWMGGSPCSGKSTISHILAQQYALTLYHVDDAMGTHFQNLDPARHPTLIRWLGSTWDERWMHPLDQLVQEAIACYSEHFTLVVADVLALPRTTPVLIEGTALLPRLLARLGVKSSQALWVIPEGEFQRAHYAQRSWMRDILADCADPETAFHNWMERDARFARWVAGEAADLGYETLLVDGKRTVDENAHTVAARIEPRWRGVMGLTAWASRSPSWYGEGRGFTTASARPSGWRASPRRSRA
ncbi:MAG TPA: hypothetical protein VMT34_08800 [Aggregatilineales bacterium]|nr:hypothetical protein [Aggregatilineales bacterium]